MTIKPGDPGAGDTVIKKIGGLAQLAPVENSNLHQKVYIQLREAIMSGKFRPGESVTLRGLASALGTSVMPARDAVLRLVTERALHSTGRSVKVPSLTFEQLQDIERFRILLEGEGASLAAERATDADISAIQLASSRFEKAFASRKVERFLNANREFHFTLYRSTHNDLLQTMIETLWMQIGPHQGYLVDLMQRSDLSKFVDLSAHHRLVDAIIRRDALEARNALAASLEDSISVYKPYYDHAVPQEPAAKG